MKDENETAGQYPDNNIGQDATGPEEDDEMFDDPEFMKTAVKEHADTWVWTFRQRSC